MIGEASGAMSVVDWLEILATLGVPAIAAGAMRMAYTAGGSIKEVKSKLASNDTATAGLGVRVSALELNHGTLSRDHNALAIAVAALPTRSEMKSGFDDLSREVRSLRSA